jgi:hypothetical protein
VIERRFGGLSAPARKRIASASSEELKAWLDRAVDAPTLGAVFAPVAKH